MRQVRAISRPRFGLRYVLGFAVLVVACERSPDTPAGPSAMLQAGEFREDAPFYYYHGRPIYLEVDPQVVMISTTEPSPQLAIADALRHEGLAVSAVDKMRNRSDHWTVRLPALDREAAQALVARLRRSGRFAFVENAFRIPGLDMPPARPVNRLSVRFKPGVSRAEADSLAQTFGLQLLRPANPDSAYYTYQFAYPRTEAPLRVAQRVYRHPLVEWAEPGLAGVVRREQARTDPYYAEQFHLRNTVTKYSVPVDINIEPAWALGPGGSTVFLAVLDDGVDLNHPDLACKPWSSFGYDLFPNHPDHVFNPSTYGGYGDMHGTAVAGVIFSCNDNGIGIAGIAPEIAMVAVRIYREDEAEPLDAAYGIDLAWMYGGADVINNSWTVAAPSQEVEDAIARATSLGRGGLGTVVVQAAGNWVSPLTRSQGYYYHPSFLHSSRMW